MRIGTKALSQFLMCESPLGPLNEGSQAFHDLSSRTQEVHGREFIDLHRCLYVTGTCRSHQGVQEEGQREGPCHKPQEYDPNVPRASNGPRCQLLLTAVAFWFYSYLKNL